MTSQTSVDVQGMIAAQGHFQNALDQVNTAYTKMAEQQSMLQANWIGETASAFGMALSQWLDDLSVVRAQLGGMVESPSQNTNVYANTNEGSQEMATSFANGLSGVPGLGI